MFRLRPTNLDLLDFPEFKSPEKPRAVFNQDLLVTKLNQYLSAKNKILYNELKIKYKSTKQRLQKYYKLRKPLLAKGHCNGLTLIWFKRISQGRANDFYTFRRNIITSPLNELLKHQDQIDELITCLRVGTYPSRYGANLDFRNCHTAFNLDKEDISDGKYSAQELIDKVAALKDSGMMGLTSILTNHVIGIYKSDGLIYIFDSNSDLEKAYCVSKIDEVLPLIQETLFNSFHKFMPETASYEIDYYASPKPLEPTPQKRSCMDFFNLFANKRMKVVNEEKSESHHFILDP